MDGRCHHLGGAHIPAILEAWYPGEFGGRAIAETLFGDNNPAGRLPITFPRTLGNCLFFTITFRSKNNSYVEGDSSPLFAFGHGLSYTTFSYDPPTSTLLRQSEAPTMC